MNTTPKISLRLTASALALATGLAIGTVAGAAVAQPASDTYLYAGTPPVSGRAHRRVDVVRAPETRRGGAPERGGVGTIGLAAGY